MSDIDLKKAKEIDSEDDESEVEDSEKDEEEADYEEQEDKKVEDDESREDDSEKEKGKEKHDEDDAEENDSKKEEKEKPKDTKKSNLKKLPLKTRIKNFFANPKKRLIFIICTGVVFIVIFGIGIYLMSHDSPISKVVNKPEEAKPTEVLYPAPLDGVMTDQASTLRHPLAIVVENHPDARPQAGLDQASIVYEAIAEGGITRYLAIFGTKEAEKVGPVRSARTYFVDWAHGYDAYFAHVGGNIDALDKIPKDKILDLDQFRYSSPYWRDKGLKVATEHTMFASTAKLREQADKNKYSSANNFNVLKFKDDPTDEQKASIPESQTVSVKYSSAQFDVNFVYDKATNSYKRVLAGVQDTDRVSKNQINPKNIVVMSVKAKPTITRINEAGWDMTTIGSGEAQIFIDGKTIKGTWKKESASDREIFYDETGAEIIFNRGQFWICVIPPAGSVSVK